MSKSKNMIKLAIAVTLPSLVAINPALANTPYFAVFGVEKQTTSISESTFDNYSLAAQAGHWIAPGVALQLGAIIPATDDTVGSVSFSLDGLYTAGLRLESPMESIHGTAAFVTAGFASARIDAASNFDQADDWFHGYFATAGLLVGITRASQLSVNYSYHAVDRAISIPAIQFGYRVQF